MISNQVKSRYCMGKGITEDEMVVSTDSMYMSLSKLQEIVKDREAWHVKVYGVTKSQTWLSNWTTTKNSNALLLSAYSLGSNFFFNAKLLGFPIYKSLFFTYLFIIHLMTLVTSEIFRLRYGNLRSYRQLIN